MNKIIEYFHSKNFLYIKRLFILIFIVAFMLEVVNVYFHFDLFIWIKRVAFMGNVLTLTSTIWKYAREMSSSPTNTQTCGMIENSLVFIKDVYCKAKSTPSVCFVLIVSVFMLVTSASAHYRLIGRTVDLVFNMRYSVDKSLEEPLEEPSEITTEKLINSETNNDSYESISSQKQPFLKDPTRRYKLSQTELNNLYFKSPSFTAINWEDTDDVANFLYHYIFELLSTKAPNEFDGFASTSLQSEVMYASELEKNMSSSDDLDIINEIRISAFNSNPKYMFAKLISSGQQRYALEYEAIHGYFSTIEYYYAHSIFWLYKCLTFEDVDVYSAKSIVSSLKMRYNDIAEASSTDYSNKKYARAISNAFKIIENDIYYIFTP